VQRVVVTGVGAVCALGSSPDTIWKGLLENRSGIRRLLELARAGARSTAGGAIESDPAHEGDLDRSLPERAIAQALAQSEATRGAAGLCWSTGLDTLRLSHGATIHRSSGEAFQQLAQHFGRPRRMIAVACASGTQAIGEAYREIRSGRLDVCVAGGSSAMLSACYTVGFDALGAIAVDRPDEDPADACKPFDRARRGFVLGDGAAALVLESATSAQVRGARSLGEIVGFGTSQDAFDLNRPPDDGCGAELCIRRTLADAALDAAEIDVVNAHGTATAIGDLAEARALARVFGRRAPVHSVKGALGHTMSAAGAIEAMVALQVCSTGYVPPTRNLVSPDPRCELDLIQQSPRSLDVRRVLSTSFGMGGQNAALILERPTR